MKLYRAIPIDGKDFVYGWYVKSGMGFHYIYIGKEGNPIWDIDGCYIKVTPETVGQSTGEDDNNSKEIYKGDLFKTSRKHGYSSNCLAEVIFEDGAFVIQLYRDDEMEMVPELILDFKRSFQDSFEIIGNIHTDKDLLDKG